jgi:hypothetical protein
MSTPFFKAPAALHGCPSTKRKKAPAERKALRERATREIEELEPSAAARL